MSENCEQDIIVDVDSPIPPKEEPKFAEETTDVQTLNETIKAEQSPDDDLDGVDTDDLLDEADEVTSPRKSLNKRKTKSTAKRTSTGRSRAKKPKDDMDIDTADNSGSEKKKSKRKTVFKKDKGKKPKKLPSFDPQRVKALTSQYPDTFWSCHADSEYNMINKINEENELQAIPCNISDQGAITSMTLSSDGSMLATFSNIGTIRVWDIENDFQLVRKLRDAEEKHIDEFYCGKFVSDEQELIVTGGKLKDRHRWSAEDEDNHILPCPIKIFNIEKSKVVGKLEGHSEEILCIKAIVFDGQNYYISTSQDGYIIKWHMESDWTALIESTKMDDGVTCMAFTVSFLPNTGNKYFLAACDEHLRLYDFEEAQLLQTFEDMYSSYCDCGKFVKWLDEEAFNNAEPGSEEVDEDNIKEPEQYAWFISRGAEMCDVSDGVSSKPNTCTLHKLVYPSQAGEQFKLEEVKRYKHEDYHSNSWLVKITSNGRYILAPTIYGQIFAFNMLTGQMTAILKEHEDIEVRDVIFHPYRPLVFSSGDDDRVKIYTYKSIEDDQIEQDLDVGASISSST